LQAARLAAEQARAARAAEQQWSERLAQMQAQVLTNVGDAAQAQRVAQHRQTIAETILTSKCPSCRMAVLDWDGCFAVTCIHCQTHFCGWCITAVPGSNERAHAHVRDCFKNPRPGSLFGSRLDRDKVYATDRLFQVQGYLLATVAPGDRLAVKQGTCSCMLV
jgi:hypothetical protein